MPGSESRTAGATAYIWTPELWNSPSAHFRGVCAGVKGVQAFAGQPPNEAMWAKPHANLSEISGLYALRLGSGSRSPATIEHVALLSDTEMSDKQLRTVIVRLVLDRWGALLHGEIADVEGRVLKQVVDWDGVLRSIKECVSGTRWSI